jgi:hypothetical protein
VWEGTWVSFLPWNAENHQMLFPPSSTEKITSRKVSQIFLLVVFGSQF